MREAAAARHPAYLALLKHCHWSDIRIMSSHARVTANPKFTNTIDINDISVGIWVYPNIQTIRRSGLNLIV
jgi:hypothetical protein